MKTLHQLKLESYARTFGTDYLSLLLPMLKNERMIVESLCNTDSTFEYFYKNHCALREYITLLIIGDIPDYVPHYCLHVHKPPPSNQTVSREALSQMKRIAKEHNCSLYETKGLSCLGYILHPANPSEENTKMIKEEFNRLDRTLYGEVRETITQVWPTMVPVIYFNPTPLH